MERSFAISTGGMYSASLSIARASVTSPIVPRSSDGTRV